MGQGYQFSPGLNKFNDASPQLRWPKMGWSSVIPGETLRVDIDAMILNLNLQQPREWLQQRGAWLV